jgi:7,8-dihydropterin-6-yl-methyl-4-(beta-D-ribofuranosyl)aminobenzene 5'-phosphate synthase
MIVKALMENTAANGALFSEHGLSLYIEAKGRRLLFDTGQSPAFADNAAKLHVDLSRVDAAVLSHAHYDHGGGLLTFLSLNRKAPVYLRPNAFEAYRHGTEFFVGLDKALQGNPQLVFVEGTARLGDGLELVTGEGRAYRQPVDTDGLCVRKDGTLVPDDFRHEQYLLITEGGRRVLISGCSHKGVVNIVHWFRPDVFIGGFHFMNLDVEGAGKAELDAAAADLLSMDTVYHTCHCTGAVQYNYLKERMRGRLFYLSGGQEIIL